MPATVEKLGPNRVRLEVDVPRDRFQESIEKVYRGARSQFAIDGFRRGKAPRAVIESRYGPGVFFQDAFDDLFPDVYSEALKDNDIVPVGPPENLQYLEVNSNTGVRFTVDVTTFPEVTLGDIQGLHAERIRHIVTDDEVDAALRRMQEENGRLEVTEDAAQDGDVLDIDFTGTLDGEPFEGGSAENQQLKLGSGRFIDGFEAQLTGAHAGEERDITVTFPENYEAEDLAGREAVFHVTVHQVNRLVLPSLDDEFAEDVSAFDTLAELRSDLRRQLEEESAQQQEARLESALVSQVAEQAQVDIPAVMIDTELDEMTAQMRQQLMYAGLSLEQYLDMQDMDLASYRDLQRPAAENTVRIRLVIEELIDALGTMPEEDEVDGILEAFAQERSQDKDKLKESISEQQRSTLAYREGVKRMLAKLKDMSEIEEVEEDTAQDPQETNTEEDAG